MAEERRDDGLNGQDETAKLPPKETPPSPSNPNEEQKAAPAEALGIPRLSGRAKGSHLTKREEKDRRFLTAEERLHVLDLWARSGLPARDFAALVGVTTSTLYGWKKRFAAGGPAGLDDRARPKQEQRLSDLTRRTIVLIKQEHPEYGCDRISALLSRFHALSASATTVSKVLHEEGYELEESPTRPHEAPVQRFERARPNQLWQTDLFTFVLKRQNRRVYMVAFMDDQSRFVVGYGLHASQSTPLVLEVFRAAIVTWKAPEEVLTDNGSQYVTWRGKSAFARECEKRGIKQIVASPRRPQTLGKIERFWGSLWRECVETAVFLDLEDARRRIGLYIDHYNFLRTHQGIDGLVPADRFFGAESEVRRTLAARVVQNALDLARNGVPKKPFYLTGQIEGNPFSIHAEGTRLILSKPGSREEIELKPPVSVAQRILDAVAALGKGPGSTLLLADLRDALADLPRAEVDETLVALERAGAVSLGRPVDLAAVTDRDREAAIENPHRGRLIYVSGSGLTSSSPPEELPPSVCPDGSPAPGVGDDPEEQAPGESPLDGAVS